MNSYDYIAEQYHNARNSFPEKEYVDLMLSKIELHSKILDLGCGTGKPIARYLIENGFRVLGIDASQEMLRIAKVTVPKAEFRQSDMINLELEERFVAIVVWDALFHIDRVHHAEIFKKLISWLEDEGMLLLSAGRTGSEGFTDQMFGHTFFYSGYDYQVTFELLKEAGFEVLHWKIDDPSSRGHVAIVARKMNKSVKGP